MATITKTFTENSESTYKATWTITATTSNITANNSTFSFTTPTVKSKFVFSGKKYSQSYFRLHNLKIGGINIPTTKTGEGKGWWCWERPATGYLLASSTSGTEYTLTKTLFSYDEDIPSEPHTKTLNTATFFNTSNKNVKTLNITCSGYEYGGESAADAYGDVKDNMYNTDSATGNLGTFATVTLNAPPTFTSSDVSINTGAAYTSITTASITTSDISVKYGGDIKANGVEFKIGNQTATRSNNGTLSINLNTAGTFTPTVSVTDSRGQVTTKSLTPITVTSYSAPVINYDIDRINENGDVDDEGTIGLVTAYFTWTAEAADLVAPQVIIKDENGSTVSADVTWYKDREQTTAISDWSELSHSDMPVYALIDNNTHDVFDTQESYSMSITPADEIGTGNTNTQTIGSAYYTVDFLAGGHGVAFGQAATQEGFVCNMPAYFKYTNEFYGKNIFHTHLDLDTGIMLRLLDASDYKYPLAYDNLWDLYVGCNPIENRHHSGPRGYTLISTGYNTNASKGNDTIHVMVPNATNTGQTTYGVLHDGYEPTTPTISISASTGTFISSTIRKYGKVVQLYVSVKNSASVASGSNIFTGTINTTELRPALWTSAGTYYTSYSLAGSINSAGLITVRNSDSRAFGAGNEVGITFTYLIP